MTDPLDRTPASDPPLRTDPASGATADASTDPAAAEAPRGARGAGDRRPRRQARRRPRPARPAAGGPSVRCSSRSPSSRSWPAPPSSCPASRWARGRRPPRGPRRQEAQLFAPFWDVYDSITKSYVGEVDRQKLVQGAIDGMIGALDDPYSSYMSPEELQRARESIGGEFSGIGAEVTTTADGRGHRRPATRSARPAGWSWSLPIDGSPAAAGGPQGRRRHHGRRRPHRGRRDAGRGDRPRPRAQGDRRSCSRSSATTARRSRCRSSATRSSRARWRRASSPAGRSRTCGWPASPTTRREQFEAALRAAREQGVTKFIVDLRDNPGGFVTAARSIASQFIEAGPDLLGGGRRRDAGGDERRAGRGGDEPGHPGGGPRQRRQRLGERDRRRGAPGHEARHARRRDDVRQGHDPAVGRPDGRVGRLPPHDRQVADARQALDPRHGPDARRRRPGRRAPAPASRDRRATRTSTPPSTSSDARRPRGRARLARAPRRRTVRRVGAEVLADSATSCTVRPTERR